MMTWDHVIPRMLLKRYHLNQELLLPCCYQCNQSKGSLTLEEWLTRLPLDAPQQQPIIYLLTQLNSSQ